MRYTTQRVENGKWRIGWMAITAVLFFGSFAKAENMTVPKEKPAGGIRTDFGDVLIENLGIGKTYNLRDLAGTPLKVTNTGSGTVRMRIDVMMSTASFITPIRRELGFAPIPSIDWVSLSQSQFIVPSGESAYTDVIIKIPNDPSLYGKKFQADIYSRTVGDNFLQIGVWSHLQLTIIDSAENQAKAEKNLKQGVIGNMDYTLLPDKLVLENFPLGKSFDVRKETKKTMMIANSGDTAIDLRVRPIRIGSTPLTLQTGFEEGDLSWVTLKSENLHVEPSSFMDPGITLTIPKDKKYAGKKYMLAVKVEPSDPNVVGVTYYGKIYVETEK